MKRTLFYILFLQFLISESIIAQSDSTYILNYPKFNISTYTILRDFNWTIEGDQYKTEYIGIGIRLKYKLWGLAITAPVIVNNDWNANNLTSFGYNYDYFHKRNAFHFVGRHYWEGENFLDLPTRDDLQFTFINIRWTHILSKNFSYRSSYRMFEQQLKSNGGFSFSTDLFYHYLPDALYSQLENNHLFQTRLSIGYTFLKVWKRYYFATIHLSSGVSQFYNSKIEQPFQFDFQPLSNARSALGFQNEDFGVSLFFNYTVNDFKALAIKSENIYWGWLLNYRL